MRQEWRSGPGLPSVQGLFMNRFIVKRLQGIRVWRASFAFSMVGSQLFEIVIENLLIHTCVVSELYIWQPVQQPICESVSCPGEAYNQQKQTEWRLRCSNLKSKSESSLEFVLYVWQPHHNSCLKIEVKHNSSQNIFTEDARCGCIHSGSQQGIIKYQAFTITYRTSSAPPYQQSSILP